jgi:chemotaxis signal transduction protein
MTAADNAGPASFVLVQVGECRFALHASTIAELAPPLRLHVFPHTSPLVVGVILRRGRIVPVYDPSPILHSQSPSAHRFYLIAHCSFGNTSELSAIPVSGECELVTGELQALDTERPKYVSGILKSGEEDLDVLDLGALLATSRSDMGQLNHTGTHP